MRFTPGALWYAVPPFLAAVPAFFFSPVTSALFLLLGAGVLGFHRDPERSSPLAGIVSPADGKVSVIRGEGEQVRVGVFMNVTDVHVNRAPIGGTVQSVEHATGAHRPAFSKDSERNERVRIAFADHTVVLIAGAFARRIHPYVEEGDELERGERLGHISFGSRADVLLPPSIGREDVRVAIGETVVAGETVIATDPEDGSGELDLGALAGERNAE